MSSSDYVIGLLAVMCIILSLKWMKNAGKKEKQYRDIEESKEWARKWNEQRAIEKELYSVWCDGKCKECDADRCPFREV